MVPAGCTEIVYMGAKAQTAAALGFVWLAQHSKLQFRVWQMHMRNDDS
jgi:DNA primase